MRDRITLLILILMALWFLGSCVGVPILESIRFGGPMLRVDDVRDANYLPPYVWPDEETFEASIHEVVYGPLVTATYTDDSIPGMKTINNSGPREVIEATSGQPITLSDGRELNIRAYRIIPIAENPGLLSFPITGEVVMLPDGSIASDDEQKTLAMEFGLDPHTLNTSQFARIPGFQLQVMLDADFEWNRGVNWALRDSITGAMTSYVIGMHTTDGGQYHGGPKSRTTLIFAHNGIRPSPLILAIDLWHKEAEPLQIDLSAPQSFGPPDQDFSLISVQSYSQERHELTTVSGEDLPHQITGRTWDHTRVTFDRIPDEFIGMNVILGSGKRSSAITRNQSQFRIGHPFEEIESLQMNVGTEQVRLIIHLPDLPIFPEQNRGLRDVRKMVFPSPTVINSSQENDNLLASILQTSGGGGIPYRFWEPGYPQDISGWTVGRFLNTTFARHEFFSINKHDFVLHINDRSISRWEIRRVGETRRRYRPFLARFYDLIQRNDVPFAFFLVLLVMRQTWLVMRVRQLLRHLQLLGYTTFGFWDADRMNRALGKRAWRVPTHDELGSIPDVDGQSVDSIIRVMRMRLKQRD